MVFETSLDQGEPAFPRSLICVYTNHQENGLCQRFVVQLNLWANPADDKFVTFFLFFPIKQVLKFHAN